MNTFIYSWDLELVLKNSPKFMVAAPYLKVKPNRSAPASDFFNLEPLEVLGSTYPNSLLGEHMAPAR